MKLPDAPSGEVIVGYSLFGGLAYMAVWMLRRTRDIDRRRDELGDRELEWAKSMEMAADAEKARLLAEIAALREELWRMRRERDDE